jgi:predicted dienelactone hydrolase
MSNRKKRNTTVIILVVLFILFIGARSNQDDEALKGPQHEVPRYAEVGPCHVGTKSLNIGRDAPLELTIWYPALNDSTLDQGITYPFEIKLGKPLGTTSIASSAGQAMKDAEYDLSDGPYPLIVLSPGFSIGSTAYAWLAEHLASYGFLVISPEHQEHLNPEDQLWRSAITRPLDILSVFTYLDDQGTSGGIYKELINLDLVAVVGHSYGGYTTLAAAGATMDTNHFQSHCENAIVEEHEAAWICEMLLPHLVDMADLAGHDTIPDDLWPASADPRVDAIVSMAGDAFFFGQSGLAEIQIPVMAIGGTVDHDSPFSWGTQPTYEYSSSSRKAIVALNGAEHMIFTGPCEEIPWYIKLFSKEFCSDTTWNRNYAHALVKHLTTAFLLAELKHDRLAASALSQDSVDFVDVSYEEQGYEN